ncbi:MAG: hypothetical protein ABR610_04505 [Thermoanaerobaculia bacterium]
MKHRGSIEWKTKVGVRILVVVAAVGVTAALALAQTSTTGATPQAGASDSMGMRMKMVEGWPKAAQEAAAFMTGKYGAPAAATPDMLVWGKAGPWKRTVIYKVEHPHEFPAHHTDVMQQWIDYKAAPEKYSDLAAYDGSVVVERTSGEISARCDKEGANFLALNLAHEIVIGKRSVADARKMYGDQIAAMKAKQPAPYTEKLLFQPMSETGDPDHAVSADRR